MSSSWSYLDPVVLPLLVGETVLDAGGGLGRWAALIESNYWEAGLTAAPAVDGFDAFEPNVEHCRRRGTCRRAPRAIFERHGYSVRGVGFGRYNSRLARGAKRLGVRNSLTWLPRRQPAIAGTIVAVKDFD